MFIILFAQFDLYKGFQVIVEMNFLYWNMVKNNNKGTDIILKIRRLYWQQKRALQIIKLG